MKVRIRFSKKGALIYIGHLDIMRYFQKLFRRAEIPVAYSEGFSPHQILSFTPPLSLGMESEGEYADVELTQRLSTKDALERLREKSVPEIGILSFRELPEKCANAMASVTAAEYEVKFPEKSMDDVQKAVSILVDSDEVTIIKKTKKNEKEMNIRPLIRTITVDGTKNAIRMIISSGSTDSIKPSHVLEALEKCSGNRFLNEDFIIKRIDQYTDAPQQISLDLVGNDII